jgi:hypothetical protein
VGATAPGETSEPRRNHEQRASKCAETQTTGSAELATYLGALGRSDRAQHIIDDIEYSPRNDVQQQHHVLRCGRKKRAHTRCQLSSGAHARTIMIDDGQHNAWEAETRNDSEPSKPQHEPKNEDKETELKSARLLSYSLPELAVAKRNDRQ